MAESYLREWGSVGVHHISHYVDAHAVAYDRRLSTSDWLWPVYREVLELAHDLLPPESQFEVRWWEIVPFLNGAGQSVGDRVTAQAVAEDMADFRGVRALVLEWLAVALSEGHEWLALLVTDLPAIAGDLDADTHRNRSWTHAQKFLDGPRNELNLSAAISSLEAAYLVVPEAGFEFANLNASIPQAPEASWAALAWSASAGEPFAMCALSARNLSSAPPSTQLVLLLTAAAMGDIAADRDLREAAPTLVGTLSQQQYSDALDVVRLSWTPKPSLAESEAFKRLLKGAADPKSLCGLLLNAALVASGGRLRHALLEAWEQDVALREWVISLVHDRLVGSTWYGASEFLWNVFEQSLKLYKL